MKASAIKKKKKNILTEFPVYRERSVYLWSLGRWRRWEGAQWGGGGETGPVSDTPCWRRRCIL